MPFGNWWSLAGSNR